MAAGVTGWGAVLLACGACYALKLVGFLVPPRLLEGERGRRVAGLVTVGLLAALVAVQTLATDAGLALDSRLVALAAAALALWLRAPFVVVVVVAALVAAALRAVTGAG